MLVARVPERVGFLAYDRSSCSRNACSCSCKLGRSSVRRLSLVAPVQQVPGVAAASAAETSIW